MPLPRVRLLCWCLCVVCVLVCARTAETSQQVSVVCVANVWTNALVMCGRNVQEHVAWCGRVCCVCGVGWCGVMWESEVLWRQKSTQSSSMVCIPCTVHFSSRSFPTKTVGMTVARARDMA